MNKHLGADLVIFEANNTIDIFFGKDGWKPHARFLKKKTAKGIFLNQVAGDVVPTPIFKQLLEHVGAV